MSSSEIDKLETIEYVPRKKRMTSHKKVKPAKALEHHHTGPINMEQYEQDDRKRGKIFSSRKNTVFSKAMALAKVCGAEVKIEIMWKGTLFTWTSKKNEQEKKVKDKHNMPGQSHTPTSTPSTTTSAASHPSPPPAQSLPPLHQTAPSSPHFLKTKKVLDENNNKNQSNNNNNNNEYTIFITDDQINKDNGKETDINNNDKTPNNKNNKDDNDNDDNDKGNDMQTTNDNIDICKLCSGNYTDKSSGIWIGCELSQCNYWCHVSCLGFSKCTRRTFCRVEWRCPQHRQTLVATPLKI